jgi:hypothetical protein
MHLADITRGVIDDDALRKLARRHDDVAARIPALRHAIANQLTGLRRYVAAGALASPARWARIGLVVAYLQYQAIANQRAAEHRDRAGRA